MPWQRLTLILILLLAAASERSAASAGASFAGISEGGDDAAPHYELAVRLMPEEHRLVASGTVRLAPAAAPRTEIRFLLSDLMSDFRVEVLSPAESAGAAKVEREGEGVWAVYPPRPVPAGVAVMLRFSYAGGEGISTVFYLGPEGSFAGGLNTAWYPYPRVGRAPGTGTLTFDVPAGYSVVATGVRRGRTEDAARGVFRFEVSRPTFFGFAAARYAVQNSPGGTIPVTAYLLGPRPDWARKNVDACARILGLLAREFGAYPYGGFAVAEVPSEQASKAGFSGASLDGLMLVNKYNLDNFTVAFYGHEIGHQWWGNLIKVNGLRGSYAIGEGMAQYGSLRAVEILEGPAAAERYRRTGYPNYSARQSAAGYFGILSEGGDHRLSDLPRGTASHLIANSKGFIVLDMLSRTVERRRFSGTMRNFTRRHAFQSVTWEQFLSAIEEGARQDLSWFYAQWFERVGAPDYQLTWTREGRRVRVVLTQPAPHFRARLEVEIAGPSRRLRRTIEIVGGRKEYSWAVPFEVVSVTLDPHYKVLRWTPEFRTKTPR
jgi:hypothetical protein